MRLCLLFVIFVLMTSLVSMISGKKFGKVVPVVLISSTLFVYYTGFIFNTFKVGYLIIIAAAVAGAVMLFMGIKKDSKRARELILTNGFYCFIAIFLVVTVMDYHRSFRNWDEFSHWGVMVKEMLRLDGFYTQDASRLLVHKDYPPFGSIFETIWCYFAGGYSESVAYKALHFLILSLVLPVATDLMPKITSSVCRENKKARSINFERILSVFTNLSIAVLSTIGLVAIISSFDAIHGFDTIYQDIPMAIILVYGLVLIMTSDMFSTKILECKPDGSDLKQSLSEKLFDKYGIDLFEIIALILVSISLVLMKQIGIAFDVVIWFYFVLRFVIRDSFSIKKRILTSGVCVAIMAVATVISEKMWKINVASFGITGQFDVKGIDIKMVREIFADSYGIVPMREVLNKYIHALLERNLTTLPVNITYFSAIFIVPLLILVVYKLSDGFVKIKDAIILGVSLFCGAVGYALVMGFTFLFLFDYSEIKDLAYYERYLGTYFLAEMLVVVLFMLYAAFSNRRLEEYCSKDIEDNNEVENEVDNEVNSEVKNEVNNETNEAKCVQASKNGQCISRECIIKVCFGIVVAFLIFANGYNLSVVMPDSYDPVPEIEARRIAALIEKNSDGQVGTFIVSEDTIESQYYVNYFCDDAEVMLSYAPIVNADYSDEQTKNDIVGMVLQGELLYVKDLSDGFNDAMKDVCKASNLKQIYAEHLYRVIHCDDGSTKLEMLAGLE